MNSKLKEEGKRNPRGWGAYHFKPKFNWTYEEAQSMFLKEKSPYNKIYYEDCIEGLDKIEDESIDLVISDPPFGLDFTGKEQYYERRSELVLEEYKEVNSIDYRKFSLKWISKIKNKLKNNGTGYIISGWTKIEDILYALRKNGLFLINHIVWNHGFGVFTKNKFVSNHYVILFFAKDKNDYFFNRYTYYDIDVWKLLRDRKYGDEKRNANKLPNDLIKKMIDISSKPNDLILDCFMGNGTTAMVCKGTFRNYIGFELNRKLKEIHVRNIGSISLGEMYESHNKMKRPTHQETLKKYPNLKKHLSLKDMTSLTSFL